MGFMIFDENIDADQKKSETAHRFDCVVKQGWHLPPRNIKVIFPKWTSTLRSFAIPLGFPGSSAGKESACNVRDPGSIPGSEGSLGKGIGYPFQYSGLENSMDCVVRGVAKSLTRLSNFHL